MSWTTTDDLVVMMCTAPDAETAARLGRMLVEKALAACVNIVPGLRSIYRWQGSLCDEPEVLMVIKTRQSKVESLSGVLRAGHPYQTPEIIALPVAGSLEAYARWVRESTSDG
jgi:periplasmic divalent cation tolerance protein